MPKKYDDYEDDEFFDKDVDWVGAGLITLLVVFAIGLAINLL